MFRSLVYVLVLGPCGHPWPNWVKKPLRPDPFAGACPETMQVQGCAERSTSQHSPLSAAIVQPRSAASAAITRPDCAASARTEERSAGKKWDRPGSTRGTPVE